jgi:hypothetical protein
MTVKAGLQYYPFRIASFAWQQRGVKPGFVPAGIN